MITEFITVTSAGQALHGAREDSAFLAGGTEILRLGSSVSRARMIGLKGLGLDTISVENNRAIGAMSRSSKPRT